MKKAVIFDLDGTLTDTLRSIQKSANLALTAFGFEPYPLDPYRYFVGNGAEELIRQCLRGRGDSDLVYFDRVMAKYREVFEIYCMYEVHPYDGIMELLAELKKRNILLAVNSNKPQERTEDVITQIFGQDCFAMLVGQSADRKRKPAPDGVFYIMEKLGLQKEDVIYIGDTCTDMMTGKSAGVFTAGALWGFRDREELTAYHADVILEKPGELLLYL